MKGLDPNVAPKKDFVISFTCKYSTTHTRGTMGIHWESGLLAANIKNITHDHSIAKPKQNQLSSPFQIGGSCSSK